MVARHLKVPHHLDGDQVAVMQTRCGRIETAVEGEPAIGQRRAQRVDVGVLGDEAPPLQLLQDVGHGPDAFHGSGLPLSSGPGVPLRRG